MNFSRVTLIFCSFILGIGILGAGYCIGNSVYLLKKMSRTVTVKGIAEQDVKSDLAIWEINYRQIGNDIIQLDQKLQHDEDVVIAFLKQQGFKDNEISRAQYKIEDRLANIYNQTNTTNPNEFRYVVTVGLRVRSAQVDLVLKTSNIANKLLQQGVLIAFDASQLNPNPSFYFTRLDSIRAPMLAKATESARAIAEQFAKDSDSKLGKIQHASQGVFQIMSSDTSTLSSDWSSNQSALGSIDKKVRLVTTLDYNLR